MGMCSRSLTPLSSRGDDAVKLRRREAALATGRASALHIAALHPHPQGGGGDAQVGSRLADTQSRILWITHARHQGTFTVVQLVEISRCAVDSLIVPAQTARCR